MPVRTIYVDVDYTLIDDQDNLYPGVEDKLAIWAVRYTSLICWSHSGAEHAKRVCKKHKIEKYFTHFLDKPDVLVDDRPMSIVEFPAILEVKKQDKWWTQEDSKIFAKSRDWVKKRLESLMSDIKGEREHVLTKEDE